MYSRITISLGTYRFTWKPTKRFIRYGDGDFGWILVVRWLNLQLKLQWLEY